MSNFNETSAKSSSSEPINNFEDAFTPARAAKIPVHVQLGITLDRTGSSQAFASGMRKITQWVTEQVELKAASFAGWLASHGDLDEGQRFTIVSENATPAELAEAAQSIIFEGGGHPHEHHLDAIHDLFKSIPWSTDSQTRCAMLVLINAESKDHTGGMSPEKIGSLIKDQGILLYLVSSDTPKMRALVEAAEGLMFEISNHPDPSEIQRISADLAASLTMGAAPNKTLSME
jgi:hypothetical protein